MICSDAQRAVATAAFHLRWLVAKLPREEFDHEEPARARQLATVLEAAATNAEECERLVAATRLGGGPLHEAHAWIEDHSFLPDAMDPTLGMFLDCLRNRRVL